MKIIKIYDFASQLLYVSIFAESGESINEKHYYCRYSKIWENFFSKKTFLELQNYNLIQQDIIETATTRMYTKFLAKKELETTKCINTSELEKIASEMLRNIYNDSFNDDDNIGTILDTFSISMEELKEYEKKVILLLF